MKNQVNVFEAKPKEIKIHRLAMLNPSATNEDYEALKQSIANIGQTEPAIMYRGRLVDGRNRLKACKELGINFKYTNLPSNYTIDDVKEFVIGSERRRDQTLTQKAIQAYKHYNLMKSQGIKTSIGEVAKKFGSTRFYMDKVRSLEKYASKEVINELENGNKIVIERKGKRLSTDSLPTLVNYYKKIIVTDELTESEIDFCEDIISTVKNTLNLPAFEYLSKRLHIELKNLKEQKS